MLSIPFKGCTALVWGSARILATDRKGRWLVTFGYLIALWLLYYLWAALFKDSPQRAGMTFESAFLHIAVAQTLFTVLHVGTDWRLAREIRSGEIATQLILPMSLNLRHFAISLGRALAQSVYILPAFIAFLWWFDLSLSPQTIALAVLSVVLSFVLLFCIDFVVGLAGFIATDLWGITASKDALVQFLGGALIPLAFFPSAMREVLAYLPFGHFFNTPVGYITGEIVSIQPVLIQAVWTVVFLFAAGLAGRIVLRKLIVFGA